MKRSAFAAVVLAAGILLSGCSKEAEETTKKKKKVKKTTQETTEVTEAPSESTDEPTESTDEPDELTLYLPNTPMSEFPGYAIVQMEASDGLVAVYTLYSTIPELETAKFYYPSKDG